MAWAKKSYYDDLLVNKSIDLISMNQTKKASRIYNGALFPIAGEYTVDPNHSFADFIAQHLIVGQVRGNFHPVTGTLM